MSLAVARDQAEKAAAEAQQDLDNAILTAKEEHLDPDLPPYTPPPGSPEAALIDGALLTPGKTPRVERDLPPQHTAPPWDHGAGAYHPHVERPPWLDDQAFDAEVGWLTREEWYNFHYGAAGVQIEQLQQEVTEICAVSSTLDLKCQQAQMRAEWEIFDLSMSASLLSTLSSSPSVQYSTEVCPPGEVEIYQSQLENLQEKYYNALSENPDSLSEITASMTHLAEEAAASGCDGVAAAARLENGHVEELMQQIQMGKAMGADPLPPSDYMVVGVSRNLAPLGKLGGKAVGKIAGDAAGEAVGQVLTKPLEWLSVSGNLIWVQECNQVLLCRSSSVGISPWPVTGKAALGWVEGGLTCEQTVASFEQATPELEAGFGLGLSQLDFSGKPGAEMGLYTPQVATGAIPIVSSSSCTIIWEGKAP